MTVQHSILESYFRSSPGKFIDTAGGWAENVDRVFGLAQHGAGLGREIALLKGDTKTAAVCESISNGFGAADGTLGVMRVIFPIERLLTGKMFLEKNDDGTWVRARIENGDFVRGADGKYVQDNQYGVRPLRSLIDITMELMALAARVMAPIKWLHGKGAYDLGKHNDRMTHATFGLWASVITLDTIQNVRAQKNDSELTAGYRERVRKRIADIICNTLDLIALPFDFGYGMNIPQLAIAGAAINCVSKGGYLIKEALYYE